MFLLLSVLLCVLSLGGFMHAHDQEIPAQENFISEIPTKENIWYEATRSCIRKVEEHPFLMATALWLAYHKGPRALDFFHDVISTWFIAIPLGGIMLHKCARILLKRAGHRHPEQVYEITIRSQQV